jgi:hypothetical protein
MTAASIAAVCRLHWEVRGDDARAPPIDMDDPTAGASSSPTGQDLGTTGPDLLLPPLGGAPAGIGTSGTDPATASGIGVSGSNPGIGASGTGAAGN